MRTFRVVPSSIRKNNYRIETKEGNAWIGSLDNLTEEEVLQQLDRLVKGGAKVEASDTYTYVLPHKR